MTTDGRLARGEATRVAILTAATSIVARLGAGALTHRAVAAEVGVSHALVTYHFSTADALKRSALLHAGKRLTDRLSELLGDSPVPADVPTVVADLAVTMVTDLRDETITLYELMAQATRDPALHSTLSTIICHVADLIEPLSGSHILATTASTALLGTILTAMALGRDQDPHILHTHIITLVQRFDPQAK